MGVSFAVGDLILNPERLMYDSGTERAWARSQCMYVIILEKFDDNTGRDDVWLCLTKFYDDVCAIQYDQIRCMTWSTKYLQYLSGE